MDIKRDSGGKLIASKKRVQNSVLKPLRAIFIPINIEKLHSENPSFKIRVLQPGVVTQACNFNTQGANAEESTKVPS